MSCEFIFFLNTKVFMYCTFVLYCALIVAISSPKTREEVKFKSVGSYVFSLLLFKKIVLLVSNDFCIFLFLTPEFDILGPLNHEDGTSLVDSRRLCSIYRNRFIIPYPTILDCVFVNFSFV